MCLQPQLSECVDGCVDARHRAVVDPHRDAYHPKPPWSTSLYFTLAVNFVSLQGQPIASCITELEWVRTDFDERQTQFLIGRIEAGRALPVHVDGCPDRHQVDGAQWVALAVVGPDGEMQGLVVRGCQSAGDADVTHPATGGPARSGRHHFTGV